MNLPFLPGHKAPRMEQPKHESKLVGGSADDQLQHASMNELFDAVHEKNPKRFRDALHAMVCAHFAEDQES
jgi:hypothetical protein